METKENLMEVKHVSFSYGKNTILSDLSFSVKEGNLSLIHI